VNTTLMIPREAGESATVRSNSPTPEALAQIQARVLWLSTAMIHHANRVRPNPTGLNAAGHRFFKEPS
jgi:hypothetical protein